MEFTYFKLFPHSLFSPPPVCFHFLSICFPLLDFSSCLFSWLLSCSFCKDYFARLFLHFSPLIPRRSVFSPRFYSFLNFWIHALYKRCKSKFLGNFWQCVYAVRCPFIDLLNIHLDIISLLLPFHFPLSWAPDARRVG